MKVALLDAFGGLAGDMFVGGLLALARREGLGDEVLAPLSSLELPDWRLEQQSVRRRSIGATRVVFHVPDEHAHRHLPDIVRRIEASELPQRARELAIEVFGVLARAEARVHDIPVEKVHFHEVGAADAILDICGSALLLTQLGIEQVFCGPLPGGTGTVRCEHGEMPCPVPAVVELLGEFELRAGEGEGEMVTPTGAALLATVGRPLPQGLAYRPLAVGYGAGTRETSVLRFTLAEVEASEATQTDEVVLLETNLDDTTPEQLAFAMERLFEAGALDVSYSPLVMKKGRPGTLLRVIAPVELRTRMLDSMFSETPTLGVREQRLQRTVLARKSVEVKTRHGAVRVKVAGGSAYPEFDDCARIAREHGLPLRQVYQEAVDAWRSA